MVPSVTKMQMQRLSSTLRTKDGRCFLYAVYLGLLDLSKIKNSVIASQIRKGVREQRVTVNCSLPMPVEPVSANFRKFEADNPHIHLNVYGTLGDESRSPVTPLYVSNNKDKDAKIVNILFTRNEEGKGHYSFIKNMSRPQYTMPLNVAGRSKCVLTAMESTSTVREHWTATSRNATHTSSMVMCVKDASMSSTLLRSLNSTRPSVL